MRRRGCRPFSSQLDLMALNLPRPMPCRKQNVLRQIRWPPNWNLENVRTLSLDLLVLSDRIVRARNSPMMTRSSSSRLSSRHSSRISRYWAAEKCSWQGLLTCPRLHEQPCATNCATFLSSSSHAPSVSTTITPSSTSPLATRPAASDAASSTSNSRCWSPSSAAASDSVTSMAVSLDSKSHRLCEMHCIVASLRRWYYEIVALRLIFHAWVVYLPSRKSSSSESEWSASRSSKYSVMTSARAELSWSLRLSIRVCCHRSSRSSSRVCRKDGQCSLSPVKCSCKLPPKVCHRSPHTAWDISPYNRSAHSGEDRHGCV